MPGTGLALTGLSLINRTMLYRFRDRDTGAWEAREGDTRIAAAIQLPIGSWQCRFVEDDNGVHMYEPSLHNR